MKKILLQIGERPLLCVLLCFTVLIGILGTLEHSPGLDDGIRHVAMGQAMAAAEGVTTWQDVLYAGYFAEHALDPWHLTHQFHKLIAGLPLVTAHKFFSVLSIIAITLPFWLLLKTFKLSQLQQSTFLVLLLLGNVQFTMRLFLARPLFIQLGISLLCIYCIFKKQWWPLIPLLVFSTLLSQVFVFPLFIGLCGGLWLLLNKDRSGAAVLLALVVGASFGVWLHPHSVEYLYYMYTIFFELPFLKNIDLAPEMKSGLSRMASPIALMGYISLLIGINTQWKRLALSALRRKEVCYLLSLTALFFVAMLAWLRMLDFFWPLGLLTAALLQQVYPDSLRSITSSILPRWKQMSTIVLGTFVLMITVHGIKALHYYTTTDAERDLALFANPLQSIESGQRVLNIDWGTMPGLFAARPDLQYARGMDPSFNTIVEPTTTPLFQQVRWLSLSEAERHKIIDQLLSTYPADTLVMWTAHTSVLSQFASHPGLSPLEKSELIVSFEVADPLY